jgi:hypothetical protein
MKKSLLFAAGIVALAISVAMIGGCATQGAGQLTPTQVAQLACPAIQSANGQLIALTDALPESPIAEKANDILTDLQKPLVAACAATGTITATEIQGLAQQVLPAIGSVLITIPLPPSTQAAIQGGLVAAEVLVGAAGVIEQQITAAKAAQAASAPAAASAPVVVPDIASGVVAS